MRSLFRGYRPLWLAVLLIALCWSPSASAQTDIPADVLTTAALSKGIARSSAIERAGDADWFKVTLRDANAYQINISGPAVIRIYNNSGVLQASSGSSKSYVWRTPLTGTFFVAALGSGTRTGAYTIKYFVYDESANTATESRMVIGTPKTGKMRNSGNPDLFGNPEGFPPDEDWIRFDVKNRGCYVIEANMSGVDFIEFMDLRDGNGNSLDVRGCALVDGTGCTGINAISSYLSPGRYYVSLLSGPAGETQGGSWTASLTARPDLEYLVYDPTSGTFVAACSL